MALDDIVEGLDNRFQLLTGGSRTLLPRQQTLEASVDWSYDLLTDEEQQIFSRAVSVLGSVHRRGRHGRSAAPTPPRHATRSPRSWTDH